MIDHLVFATDDLERTVGWFADTTGVIPTPGGRHLGWGTRNELVGLDGGSYLEIIGPDRAQPDPGAPRPFGIDHLVGERMVTWCARPDGTIEEAAARCATVGHDVGPAAEMSRRRPDGAVLSWRLTAPVLDGALAGVVPFLIDWLDSEHPSRSLGSPIGLTSLTLLAHEHQLAYDALHAIGTDPRITGIADGPPGLVARLATPRGAITLGTPPA